MNKFIKSIWFPIALFIIIELIFFIIGMFNMSCAQCEPCPMPPTPCPTCPCTNTLAIFGIIPSAIISIIAYFLIKKFSK